MTKYSLFIGRFQPLHEGHKRLIQTVLDEGKLVCVALMDTEPDEKNPYSLAERMAMFQEAFGPKVKIAIIPPIDSVCYGRNVGYWIRRIHLDAETEAITATAIRAGNEPKKPAHYDPDFINSFNHVAERIHACAAEQGFWADGPERNIGEAIALVHSELSEALECFRAGNPADKNITTMTGGEVQLADVIMRIMDMAKGYGLNIAEAILQKLIFNETREPMHGKEF